MGRAWPKPGEPLFTEEDTLAVLEWQREQSLLCPGCGLPRDETMAKERQFDFYDARAVRCHACAARDRKARQFTKQDHDDAGLYFVAKEIDG